ncbi:hypothetical protein [Kitasatospora azatica]|uniref:hypothetical protein n=1 Tax=Kitasatospora azatica TaxID=58347 RepID=UPI00056019CB|nr:hypothetical protein [Kitasatospora azatica]
MSLRTTPAPAARTEVLDIPVRVPATRTPYWHTDSPLLAVTHVDPQYARLRELFPEGWVHLAQAKSLIDGVAALEVPEVVPAAVHLRRVAPLLTAAAHELIQFAETEQVGAAAPAAEQARTAADRLLHYAHTQVWKEIILSEPVPGTPWLYCGPLNTWAMNTVNLPIGMLVVTPNASLQQEIEAVNVLLPGIQPVIGGVLGGAAKSIQPEHPTMQIVDLLLAGGESRVGHKNFAHFFPLEAPHSRVEGPEFTVVFANVHADRLERCSLNLLDRYQEAGEATDLQETLRASLRWFRCHDLAHFWRRTAVEGNGSPAPGLTPFEAMTLEETYADVLGLVSAASFFPGTSLGQAYLAELLRYLSRRHHHFADSGAAMLTAGWLVAKGVSLQNRDDHWLDKALPLLEELAVCLHRALWEADSTDLDELRDALAIGTRYRDGLAELYQTIPTDLEYTFG